MPNSFQSRLISDRYAIFSNRDVSQLELRPRLIMSHMLIQRLRRHVIVMLLIQLTTCLESGLVYLPSTQCSERTQTGKRRFTNINNHLTEWSLKHMNGPFSHNSSLS